MDKFKSFGVSEREVTNNFAALVTLPIIIAFSKQVIFDWTEDASGDDLVGLFPVSESLGAGCGGF